MGVYNRVNQIAHEYTAARWPQEQGFEDAVAVNQEHLWRGYQRYYEAKRNLLVLEADDFAYMRGKQSAIVQAETALYKATDALREFGDPIVIIDMIQGIGGEVQTSFTGAATGEGT